MYIHIYIYIYTFIYRDIHTHAYCTRASKRRGSNTLFLAEKLPRALVVGVSSIIMMIIMHLTVGILILNNENNDNNISSLIYMNIDIQLILIIGVSNSHGQRGWILEEAKKKDCGVVCRSVVHHSTVHRSTLKYVMLLYTIVQHSIV